MNEKKEKEKKEEIDLNRFFDSGEIFNASEEKLNQVLKQLCTEYIPNEMVRHRAMNRCMLVNTIKNFKFMNKIEKSNRRLTKIVIVLMVITIILSGALIWLSINSSQNLVSRFTQNKTLKTED